jgi:hypothetical protein
MFSFLWSSPKACCPLLCIWPAPQAAGPFAIHPAAQQAVSLGLSLAHWFGLAGPSGEPTPSSLFVSLPSRARVAPSSSSCSCSSRSPPKESSPPLPRHTWLDPQELCPS